MLSLTRTRMILSGKMRASMSSLTSADIPTYARVPLVRHIRTSPVFKSNSRRNLGLSLAYFFSFGRNSPRVTALILRTSKLVGTSEGPQEHPCLTSNRQSLPNTSGYLVPVTLACFSEYVALTLH